MLHLHAFFSAISMLPSISVVLLKEKTSVVVSDF